MRHFAACSIARQFAALLLLWSAAASASEPELFGVGARSAAMGDTGVADAEGWEATYANPAGVVGPTRRRITVGYVGARYHLSLDGEHRPEPRNGIVDAGRDAGLGGLDRG